MCSCRVGLTCVICGCSCLIRSYRGNVEAQFSATQSSCVQLLYRKDRYFSTHNVRLKDLYPMIEWYKQHRHSFLPVDSEASPAPQTPSSEARVRIKDLRENMVANVVCRIRERTLAERSRAAQEPLTATITGRGASDMLGGVLLRELVMQDDAKDTMLVNLWDQHAESKFVARLLSYSGIIELQGLVISFNGIENRLLANTTPQTSFRFLDAAQDSGAAAVQRKLKSGIHVSTTGPSPASEAQSKAQAFVSVEELEGSATSQGLCVLCVLDGVRVEQILFDQLVGTPDSILPESTPLLVERYCGYCDEALPVVSMEDIPPSYGECRNEQDHPRNKRDDQANRRGLWRYRPFLIILRDMRHKRLQLRVENQACVELVAHIPAEKLIYPFDDDTGQSLPFDVRSTVAAMLTALVADGEQAFRAEIDCRTLLESSGLVASLGHTEEQHTQTHARVYSLVSLTPNLLPNGRLPA